MDFPTLAYRPPRRASSTLPRGRFLQLAVLALAVTCVASFAAPAAAQQRTFYLDRIQVSGAPDDGLVLWRPYFPEKHRFYAAAGVGYTLNPLRASTIVDNPRIEERIANPVRHQLVTHLTAGLELPQGFSVGAGLPVAMLQEGGADPLPERVGGGLDRRPVALHDLRLDARARVFQSSDQKLRLGVGGAIWLPTGNSRAFTGDGQTTGYVYGNGEYDFGKFLVAGQAGPHFRPSRGILGENGVLEVGSELRFAAGVFFPLRGGDLRVGGTLWGTTGIQSGHVSGRSTFLGGRNTDLEWLAEVRTHLDRNKRVYVMGGGGTRLAAGYGAPDVRLLGMIGTYASLLDFEPGQAARPRRKAPQVDPYDLDSDGDGYPDAIDKCPHEPEDGLGPDPTDGCPAEKDSDGDGIPDSQDKCPHEPEDFDGIQDNDGCPETDADGDGIPDTEDACPTTPGVENKKDPSKHGCPLARKKIIETEGEIQLLEPIQFEFAKSNIKPVSYPILDEVVEVMEARPDIRLAVHGHTDSVGSRDVNMRLSRDRAAAVMRYLIGKGVSAKRLESAGFGPDQPVSTNATAEGRAKNRRVEFKVLTD